MVKKVNSKGANQTKAGYWKAFAEHVLNGHNYKDAYLLARPQCQSWSPEVIRAKASHLANDPKVIAYQEAEVRKLAERRRKREAKLMSNLDRREVCLEVANDEKSNGMTRLTAVKVDAQLAGEWMERVDVSGGLDIRALLAELPQDGLPVPQAIAIEPQPAALPGAGGRQELPSEKQLVGEEPIAWEVE